ncbi:hypothetical protein QGX11_gp104 [Pseudomonas phage PPSC2]|uniref:Uncharacterized protein n=1 Tax=Pseudomonas phage PPSC2 TaxID=2041350 RepID=A0A2R2YAW4_9CAUD|nr:hypothetical protein QGX11_gp104 [Pseudomonas phage PPSC2]ATN92867.1 hypothetical protein PPSC2_104 [Pseudomonas phage PPSC2]
MSASLTARRFSFEGYNMNSSVYAALNGCSTTGLEEQIAYMECPTGQIVRLFRDHKGWHRIVLFESIAPNSGVSAVLVQADGEVHYKETAPKARGNNYTRMLQVVLTVWGIKWYRSTMLTVGGAACYKD